MFSSEQSTSRLLDGYMHVIPYYVPSKDLGSAIDGLLLLILFLLYQSSNRDSMRIQLPAILDGLGGD